MRDGDSGAGRWASAISEPERNIARSELRPRAPAPPEVDAALQDLPRILVDPPWLRVARRSPPSRARTPVVPPKGIEPLESHCELVWRGCEPFVSPWSDWHEPKQDVPAHVQMLVAVTTDDEAIARNVEWLITAGQLPNLNREAAAACWCALGTAAGAPPPLSPLRALGLLGRASLPGLFGLARRWLAPAQDEGAAAADLARVREEIVTALSRVDSPEVAPLMARALACAPSLQLIASNWMLRHPETAATGPVPAAMGAAPSSVEAARAICLLAARGQVEACRAAARRHGIAVVRHVDHLLEADPWLASGPAKNGASLAPVPRAAARPRLRSGKLLPASAVAVLLEMLRFSPIEPAYPGLAEVRDACDPSSIEELAIDLASSWVASPRWEARWPFYALGHLGGDDAVAWLAPRARHWLERGPQALAPMAFDVLAMIGNDAALAALEGLTAAADAVACGPRIDEAIDAIRLRRGLGAASSAQRPSAALLGCEPPTDATYLVRFVGRVSVPAFLARSTGTVIFANRRGTAAFQLDPGGVRAMLAGAIRGRDDGDGQLVLPLVDQPDGGLYLVFDRADSGGFEVRLEQLRWTWGLTERQADVLRWLVLGDGNKAIAQRLHCAEVTVELHVTALLRKASVDGRARLIAKFWRGG
jgi:DNA-binding CsgD family transcriptional regulator